MEELKIELDACRRRLDAKYKAVAILKQQAELADTELKKTERRASETSKRLEQEVSKLQFELEWRESSFIDSQQTWAARFDRVCQENAILMSRLEARNEELRRANAHKSAIARERDELLALLDVTERLKYEQGKSKVAEEDYGSFSSSELAVLGACKCRVSNPEPCGCAHAAANMRKEVAKLREELECTQQRREESNLTVSAYRTAFEEQLGRSRNLSLQLAKITTISSRSAKAKAAIKWLIQVLNDDDYAPPKSPESGTNEENANTANMSLPELVIMLTDMIHQKNEAMAHQKLIAQVLADKVQRLEDASSNLGVFEMCKIPPPPPAVKENVQVKLLKTPRSEETEASEKRASEDDPYIDDEMFKCIAEVVHDDNTDVFEAASEGGVHTNGHDTTLAGESGEKEGECCNISTENKIPAELPAIPPVGNVELVRGSASVEDTDMCSSEDDLRENHISSDQMTASHDSSGLDNREVESNTSQTRSEVSSEVHESNHTQKVQ